MNMTIFSEMLLKAVEGRPILDTCLMEIDALRQQLADSQKQVTMLRDVLHNIKTYADSIDDANNWCEEALAATADLKDVHLCEREPVACYQGHDKASGWETITLLENIPEGTNLYIAAK
jgi:hypothetical protein